MRDRGVRGEEGYAEYNLVIATMVVSGAVVVVAVVGGHAAVTGGLGHGIIAAIEVVAAMAVLAIVELAVTLLVERVQRRRLTKPFVWVRPQRHEAMSVALASGGNVSFDGVDVRPDAGVRPEEVTASEEAWVTARPDRLPAPLDEAARARWASLELGLTGRTLGRWLRDLDRIGEHRAEWDASGRPPEEFIFEYAFMDLWLPALWWVALGEAPTPEAMGELLEAGIVDGNDACSWADALGHRPRPDEVRVLLAAGWGPGHEASHWARAFGRLPDRSECAPLLAGGVEGWQAEQWAQAMGGPPTIDAIHELERAGVEKSYDSVTWAETIGIPLTPAAMRPWQDAGVRDASDLVSWRWALGADLSPAAIRNLRSAGVQNGGDAARWAKALGQAPTAQRVSTLMSQGILSGKEAEQRLAVDRR